MGKKYSIFKDAIGMIQNDKIIGDLIYGDTIQKLVKDRNIGLSEAREELSKMSFLEYRALSEAPIVPPSGQTIGPTSTTGTSSTSDLSGIKSLWPGKGAPVQMGMTVGMKGQDGIAVPGQVSQVDQSANGVKVRNPTTNQDEWINMDALEPFQDAAMGTAQPTEEAKHISRLRELAGIRENSSAGATGAGGIAIAPTAMGGMQKRSGTTEQKKEYYRTAPVKTIIGDTKPQQASGELSATLAANGKKTASRINNGRKKK
jgi:hypothetical protein